MLPNMSLRRFGNIRNLPCLSRVINIVIIFTGTKKNDLGTRDDIEFEKFKSNEDNLSLQNFGVKRNFLVI